MNIDSTSFSFTESDNEVFIGKYCSIAPNVMFTNTGTHIYETNKKVVFTTNWDQKRDVEPIIIGNDVWVCEGVRILAGVKVGNGAILGAGAVIAKDVPPYAVVVGNPQQIKRFRFTEEQIEKLEKIQLWNWDKETILERKEYMLDIDVFLSKYSV